MTRTRYTVIVLVVVSLILGPFIIAAVFLGLPKKAEQDKRHDACEAIWTTIREPDLKWAGYKWGCLITWPDGSTRLVDYEAYK